MCRPIPQLLTCRLAWVAAVFIWFAPLLRSLALDLPAGLLTELKSDEFQTRETAQTELLAWARQRPNDAMDALYGASRTNGDPEVRERCLAVLRELVIDEYLKDGEGFIGIRLQEETALVPGDAKPRSVIRVIQVVRDSAAQQAGVKLNDLIAGLDDKIWHDESAVEPFMAHIRQLKPGSRVILRILRNGEMIDLEVKLGRRPPGADNRFLDQRQVDLEAAEKAAKDAYFRRWLEHRKRGN